MLPPNLPITSDDQTGRYILRYDASLHKIANCRRKVWFQLFNGYRHGDKNFKIEYGSAFHKFLQLYYSGKPIQDCINAGIAHYSQPDILIPEGDFRSIAHLCNCMMQYADFWKYSGDLIIPDKAPLTGEYILEGRFAYPFYRTDRVEVLLCGTMDFKGTFAGQQPIVVDHKTTALNQVDNYLNSYLLSPQLMTYKLVHDKLFGGDVAMMINGIFLSRSNKNTFKRSAPITFSKRQIQLFEKRLKEEVVNLVNAFEWMLDNDVTEDKVDAIFPPNFTCCEEKYGPCEFTPACLLETYAEMQPILEMNFTRRTYDPLKFGE